MSRFGMQMPGGGGKRRAGMDVYTGLMFAAVAALAIAVGVLWQAASTVGPEGNPLELQDPRSIRLADGGAG